MVRHIRRFTLTPVLTVILSAAMTPPGALAQDPPAEPSETSLTAEVRAEIVQAIGEHLAESYIYEEMGISLADLMKANLGEGRYDGIDNAAEFAKQLTDDLQSVSNDRHLRVFSPQNVKRRRRHDPRAHNYGFYKVERLEHNVGLLELRGFSGRPPAFDRADAVFSFLADVDAMIIDLRNNGGGGEEMLQYIASRFFDEPTVLLTDFMRGMKSPRDVMTLDSVPASMADVPLYILTSSSTFSAAEAFTFAMDINDRATIIGETTGGGGHYGGQMPLVQQFSIWMPVGRAYDKRTGEGWEAKGITPDIETSADGALDAALAEAQADAKSRAEPRQEQERALQLALETEMAEILKLARDKHLPEAVSGLNVTLQRGREAGIVDEADINRLGSKLINEGLLQLAIATFQFNAEAYPNSSHVLEGLAEAYMNAHQHTLAMKTSTRALELDPTSVKARNMIRTIRELGTTGESD